MCIGCLFCCFCCGAFSFRHGRVLCYCNETHKSHVHPQTNPSISLFFALFLLSSAVCLKSLQICTSNTTQEKSQPVIKYTSLFLFLSCIARRTLTTGLATDHGQLRHSLDSAITGVDMKFGEPSIIRVGPLCIHQDRFFPNRRLLGILLSLKGCTILLLRI